MEKMKKRVQIWMDAEAFRRLKSLLEDPGALDLAVGAFHREHGTLCDLMDAVEQAWCNSSNYEEG